MNNPQRVENLIDENIDPLDILDDDPMDTDDAKKADFDSKLNEKIKTAMDKIIDLESERSAINADMQTIITGLESQGVNRHAFKFAFKFYKMDEEQRESMDYSLHGCRNACGIGVTKDMFE